jgi:hypothetical protein
MRRYTSQIAPFLSWIVRRCRGKVSSKAGRFKRVTLENSSKNLRSHCNEFSPLGPKEGPIKKAPATLDGAVCDYLRLLAIRLANSRL